MKVLYFSTPTCGPCRYFYPLISEYLDSKNIQWEKIDMSEEQNFHFKDKYSLNSVPITLILEGEEVTARIVGPDLQKVKESV